MFHAMFHGYSPPSLNGSGLDSLASVPFASMALQKRTGRRPLCFFDEYLRQKSFLRYARRQVSRTAGAPIARAQLGGMRFGRVQAPSRIFLSAMWIACTGVNRFKDPSSIDHTTWRISSGAAALVVAAWISRFRRASSKTESLRGPRAARSEER